VEEFQHQKSIWVLKLKSKNIAHDKANALGQATRGFEAEDVYDFENNALNGFGLYESECQGCGLFTNLNDLGLCEE